MRCHPALVTLTLAGAVVLLWVGPASAQEASPPPAEVEEVDADDDAEDDAEDDGSGTTDETELEPVVEPEPVDDFPAEPPPEPSSVRDQATPEADSDDPGRHLAIGASILKEHGFAGVIRARYRWVGLEVAGGWSPYLLAVTGACNEIVLDGAVRFTFSALGFFAEEGDMSHGARAGAIWDWFFGWGAMLGYQVEYELTDFLIFSAGAGVQVFPFGDEPAVRRMSRECPSNVRVEAHPLTTVVQPYIGFSFLLYLF